MKIGITNDHHGHHLKEILTEFLDEAGYNVIDYGANTGNVSEYGVTSGDIVDFPVYAFKLGDAIKNKDVDLGIAICGSGIGMSIALNKVKGVYCAKISTTAEAISSRAHNDANCIAFGQDLDEELAKEIAIKFIETPFSNIDRYIKRNNMIKFKENE
jgi:ribose 5-phosphate isomerase B